MQQKKMMLAIEQELTTLLQYDPPWQWRGNALELIKSKDPEIILSGPAETGKTWAACYKAHMACREYPGAQGALVRKVYGSISGTVYLTMKRIIGSFPVNVYGGDKSPEIIIYPNGSQIWIGGMDNPTKVLSGERDFIQVCQAEELNVNDWEYMTTRTTGRGAVMPYTQIFGDCNPGGSKSYLKTREQIRLLSSYHKDNPTLFDDQGNITEQGERTLGRLEGLSGIRRKRLFEGIWATAEGVVYDTFDSAIHVKTRERDEFKVWYLAMDEGYTNPAVILLVGEDSDGRRHVFREWYERGKLQSAVVEKALEWWKEYHPALAAVDEAAAGLIADLRNNGINAVGAKGRVLDGIQLMQDRLKVQGDGLPRETVDPSCINHINEYESYVWKKQSAGGFVKDEPDKKDDHSMDARRYLEVAGVGGWLAM
jgi:PBSX family phage terminase large subunit